MSVATSHKPQPFIMCPPSGLLIDDSVFQKVMYLVRKSPIEISGLGKVVQEHGKLRVVSMTLLPQKNSAVTTDIDGEDIGKAMYELRDSPGTLSWHWHSHVDMATFWSGTDLETIAACGQGGWFTATVFNKKAESRSAFYMKKPVELFWDQFPCSVDRQLATSEMEAWDKEYTLNCKSKWHDMREDTSGRWKNARNQWAWNKEHGYRQPSNQKLSKSERKWLRSAGVDEKQFEMLTFEEQEDLLGAIIGRYSTTSDDAPAMTAEEQEEANFVMTGYNPVGIL